MGVLTCSRGNCENVMCDRLSSDYGYICNGCFDELNLAGQDVDIHNFMNSYVGDYSKPTTGHREYLDEIFPITG